MANMKGVKMNNGYIMPCFGLGTFESFGETEKATKHAIDLGYRHFDTAYLYGNEREVGQAIRSKIEDGVVKREDIFLVTKLWNTFHEPEKVENACRKSLENFGLDYIDLYLMHYPVGFVERKPYEFWPLLSNGKHEHTDTDYCDTWQAMEKLVDLGIVRSIGISNFNSQQIDRLLAKCRIKPVNNQIEVSPMINQKKLIKFCNDRDIVITSYCPLGRPMPELKKPTFLYDGNVKAIADKYKKTPAQIVFRYLIEIGTIPIPKSVNENRIKENINVFDFQLTEDEIKFMDSFNNGERVIDFLESKGHKYWPFDIEY